MTGWDVIDRATVLHALTASGLPIDSETCQSAEYVRLNLDWVRDEFIPFIRRNAPNSQGDGFRCIHFVHWMIHELTLAGYWVDLPHSHACASLHVSRGGDMHAVGLFLATDGNLYVLDPQEPSIVPINAYRVLGYGRVRFL
jgi:hypothetical protein